MIFVRFDNLKSAGSLVLVPQQRTLITIVRVADNWHSRLRGLLGEEQLPADQALWIKDCNSIHMWFMQFPIDAVFTDAQLRITKICCNLRPWQMTWPHLASKSVFEMPCGTADGLKIGDQLHVGA